MVLAITEEFGRFEELFSDVIYPVWPVWLAGAALVLGGAMLVAYRLGWHEWALQHKFATAGIVVAILAIGAPTGWYTVSPLFDRETVCEASPLAGAGTGSDKCEGVAVAADGSEATAPAAGAEAQPPVTPAPADATEEPAFEARVATRGTFQGADDFHFGEGTALLIESAPESYTLRFEDFSVRNGPDLFVYLSTDPRGYSDDALLLGELKGTDGAFNYDVPPGTDVSKYKSVVIWCKAFSVLFATAPFA